MMRSMTFGFLLLLVMAIGISGQRLNVPTLSPQSEVTQEVALTDVKLSYARPSSKGRKVFGGLVPFSEVWRTGANASTKITFKEDVKIEGNDLKAGTYALYTIPGEKEWTIIIHNNITHRALTEGVYKQAEDAFRFLAKPETTDYFIETFTIEFSSIKTNSVDVVLSWENTRVRFGIEFAVNEQVDKQAAQLFADPASAAHGNYFLAAEYYFHNLLDLNKSVEWINAALAKKPKDPRYGLLLAKILYKQGKKADALRVIAEANAWAKETKNANYTDQTQLFWDSIR